MSHAVNGQPMTSDSLSSLYAPIRGPLDEVETILRRELCSPDPKVDRLVKHGFRLGGKRLRPALMLLSAKACGSLRPEHSTLAAAMELIHTATLIHDDVLDEAQLRRHIETVNARWDNETSILLGDYVVARALCLAASVDDVTACREIGRATRLMCEGELRQIVGRGNYDLTEAEYLEIISGKTAELCACCCRLGAHYAGAPDAIADALGRYGFNLGIAFQIADDLLDVLGDESTTGKSLGTDLLKQKTTLPLIRLLAVLDPSDRDDLLGVLSDADAENGQTREALRPWLARTDALDYARRRADDFVQQAIAELDALPSGPLRDVLARLAEFVITRQN
ncbi:MAG TPA: polyprenyl synthetase family protein [Thermoguttaceae bacterium]|nr:polyprenyl synthetase family protein [Thermoguttaceae bacterium]